MSVTVSTKFVDDWTNSDWVSTTGAEYLTAPIFGTNDSDDASAAPTKFVSSYDAKFIPLGWGQNGTYGNSYPFPTLTGEVWVRQFYLSNSVPYYCNTRSFSGQVIIKAGVYKKSRNTAVLFAITTRANSAYMMSRYKNNKTNRTSSSAGTPAPYPEAGMDPNFNPNLLTEVLSDGTLRKVNMELVKTIDGGSTSNTYDIWRIGEYDRQSGGQKQYYLQGFFYSSTMSKLSTITASYIQVSGPNKDIKLQMGSWDNIMNTYGKSYTVAQLQSYIQQYPNRIYPTTVYLNAVPDVTLHFPQKLMNYSWSSPYFQDKAFFEVGRDSPCIRFSSSDKQPKNMKVQSSSLVYTSDLDTNTAYSTPSFATKDGYLYTELTGYYTSLEKLMPADVWNYPFKMQMTFVPETSRSEFTAMYLPNGTTIYDTTDPFTVTYNFTAKANESNVPNFVTAIGTRFRNHNAKYAVLANDFDYFDYSWRGTVDSYQRDPTVSMTMSYGDQVVVTKTMDGSSSAASTFQHGPFLVSPTTQGQLVQITGVVQDRRGRTSETKVFTITDNKSQDVLEYLRFYNYSYPNALVQAYRCLSDGTPDDENGNYVSLTATWAFSQLDYGLTNYSEGTTDGKLVIRVRPHSGTLSQDTWNEVLKIANGNKKVMLKVGLDQSIDIDVAVTDFIGNVFNASQEFIPSSQVVMDFRAGGEGLAVGKRSEFNKAMEVAWDTTFYGNVNVKGNINISGKTQQATTADAVTYYDTYNLGARHVQAALDVLATKTGLTQTQCQNLINQAIRNLDIPTDAHINELIATKINNIVFPPSISEARALELITAALGDYYTKAEVDERIQNVKIDEDTVESVVEKYIKGMPTSSEAVKIANEAHTIATQAISLAQTANDTANDAAEDAHYARATALGIESKADRALNDADSALTLANTAAADASEALERVKEALAGVGITKSQAKQLIANALTDYRTETQIIALINTKFNSIVNANNIRY